MQKVVPGSMPRFLGTMRAFFRESREMYGLSRLELKDFHTGRGSGRTTKQLKLMDKDDIFLVGFHSDVDYTVRLMREHRPDLDPLKQIMRVSPEDRDFYALRGRNQRVVVDHHLLEQLRGGQIMRLEKHNEAVHP